MYLIPVLKVLEFKISTQQIQKSKHIRFLNKNTPVFKVYIKTSYFNNIAYQL